MQVEIWSDVVCPWCAVGRAHFQQALAGFPEADRVRVRWRSFELDPSAPRTSDGPYVDRLAAKYGTSRQSAQAMIDQMTARAAAVGLDFRFDRARPGNTFDAHRVLHLAADRDVQDRVKERLLTGYLTEGEAIGEAGTLQRLAVDAGPRRGRGKDGARGRRIRRRGARRRAAGGGPRDQRRALLRRRRSPRHLRCATPEVLRRVLDQAQRDASRLDVINDDTADCTDGSCAR